jgi:hypothetical protein
MEVGVWLNEKPVFDKECVFVTSTKWGKERNVDYKVWEVKWVDGFDENGLPASYLGLLDEGCEWGPLDDVVADFWFIIPPEK